MTDIVRQKRALPLFATFLFLAAYAATLVLVLAPKDMFSATPAALVQGSD